MQGRIQDLIGGAPDRDWPKTAILGLQFCRILVLGPHFWWSGGPPGPPGSTPDMCELDPSLTLGSFPCVEFSHQEPGAAGVVCETVPCEN